MRDIKFRVWLPLRNQMAAVKVLGLGTFEFEPNGAQNFGELYEYDPLSQRTPSELMQYTGLKDKNGVEIYEGDILADRENKRWGAKAITEKYGYYIVKWDGEKTGFAPFSEQILDAEDPWYNRVLNLSYLYVIGNIYENPELLEANHAA